MTNADTAAGTGWMEDIDMSEVENHISYCWLKCAYVEDGVIHFDRESLAKIIIERDDVIRRECYTDKKRIDWLMRHIPGDALRLMLSDDMSCTNNIFEFCDKIDAILSNRD